MGYLPFPFLASGGETELKVAGQFGLGIVHETKVVFEPPATLALTRTTPGHWQAEIIINNFIFSI